MQQQLGGAELGQGMNGAVLDIYKKGDANTIVSMLEAGTADDGWVVHTFNKSKTASGVDDKVVTDAKTKRAIINAMIKQADAYVGKISKSRMLIDKSNEKLFRDELESAADILRVYALEKGGMERIAIEPIDVKLSKSELRILGISVANLDLYCIFSRRCDQTLDDIEIPNSSAAASKTLKQILTESLRSLAILHRGLWLHTDVKPDNIIRCGRRFKLIDFGGAISFKSAESLEEAVNLVNVLRTRNPLAWYIAGGGVSAGEKAAIIPLAYVYGREVFGSGELATAIGAMFDGIRRYVAAQRAHVRMGGEKKKKLESNSSSSSTGDAVRCMIVKEMLPCIDSMALALAMIATLCRAEASGTSVTDTKRADYFRFLYQRMLVMDHPRFLGHQTQQLADAAAKEL